MRREGGRGRARLRGGVPWDFLGRRLDLHGNTACTSHQLVRFIATEPGQIIKFNFHNNQMGLRIPN